MSNTDISQVLTQMRVMAARAQGIQTTQVNETGQTDFSELLKKSIDGVNETQKQAGSLTEAFQAGDPQVDLAQVMVALQKANVSFTAMKEVRNKLIGAYQEVMRMQV